jgi:hypothetical protein
MMVMPSPAHELYRENLRLWCDVHRTLDLEAREVLQACYAA